ncbi:glutaredoxin [Pendulispora rubella]|uniref:Glutaredoxin n=1 Tax=Pendulispora rubella TaxID=2741070 RepID=A0ABZ2KZN7_9BACT
MAPPTDGSRAEKPYLDPARIAPAALHKMSAFHADVIREVEHAMGTSPVVVVGMAQNPHVKKVRKALTAAGIAFTYLEYGSYFSGWKKRLAIKLWSGWPTFPQVFLRGVLLGGEDLTLAAIAEGQFRNFGQLPAATELEKAL